MGFHGLRAIVGWGRGCEILRDRGRKPTPMARWPRHVWTSIFTYGTVFVLFPLLCLLAYAWVRGWVF